ncbi:YxcD family protein [Sporosarcina sp. NPDC096371]|uniref:YxcD family protein n=1 Tax=Sporosarcina sp. NPDC096371 TaxID=3364530 RepID=UPI0037F325F7
MERLILSEQNIINAICFYHARKKYVIPEQVEVELFYDDEEEQGFSAEASVNGQQQVFMTPDLIAALRLWIDEFLNRDPFAARIELLFDNDEGITAAIY